MTGSGHVRTIIGMRRLCLGMCLCVTSLATPQAAKAVTHLKAGMAAPPISLPDLRGVERSQTDWAGRTIVLIFGELYHDKTLAACREVASVLEQPRFADQGIEVVLVVAKDDSSERLEAMARDAGITPMILHDRARDAFGAYRVAVMPSTVVIDGDWRVVHATASFSQRYGDIIADALLMSSGIISRDEFEHSLHPEPAVDGSDDVVRATRTTQLARQLMQRGLLELSEEKYVEALALAPDHVPALLGRGSLLLRSGRLAEAEMHFRAVLEHEPQSVEATLGLAYVQALRGGEELPRARMSVRELLALTPDEPRANYLLGLIYERSGQPEEAMASYRRSAELLMSRGEAWNLIPGSERDER